jgi:hypothetical protein
LDYSYEFDFGSDPDEPESENSMTEQPLSGPATGLVITFTPAGRFVYWQDRKPTDLTDRNSRYVAYLDSLPFQEGTPLAPTEEHTPTEVATTNSGLCTPDRQVFMAVGETPGPSGTRPHQEGSASGSATNGAVRESLPIRNLAETLDQVASRVHTTPE